MGRGSCLIWKVLVCVLFAGGVVLAQVTTGTVLGTLSDSTGAVIPGATVTIRNVETGISRTATTDAAGRYRVPQLGLGDYEVTAEATGFQATVRSGITLTVGREATVDFILQVGAVTERITVTGEAPLVQTTNATVSTLVDEQTMRDLPLNGRSFGDLASIQPGVVSDIPISSGTIYTAGGGATRRSVGGTKPQQSTYLLDGVEISTPSEGIPVNSVLGQQLGVDAIREFTVLQNNYGAQFGRAAGGVVNAVTQSGTNSIHGSAFEFLRNDALDARDFFLLSTLPKAPLKRNQFGASLGGPIQKDRTFFFLNYEGVRQSAGENFIGATYTPETRAGRVTSCPAGMSGCTREQSIKASPLTLVSSTKPILDLLPLPNGTYRSGGVADLNGIPNWTGGENYGIVRIDRQLATNDSLFGRLTIDRSSRTDETQLATPVPNVRYQTGGYVLAAISETHVFSPAVLNTIRVGYTRRNDNLFYTYSEGGDQYPNGAGLDPRLAVIRGIPLGLFLLPGVSIYGNQPGFVGPDPGGPAHFVDNTFEYDDAVNINRGGHSIVIGANFKRYQMNEGNFPFKYGNMSWQTVERLLTARPFSTNQWIGQYQPGSQVADLYRGWRQAYGAVYVQDDFRVLPNLTLNLGVRWEKATGPKEVNGKLATLKNPFTDSSFAPLTKEDRLFSIRDGLKGFSPRIGLAWTPFSDQKTVFRGGFGAFKEVPLVYIYQLLVDAPPYAIKYQPTAAQLTWPFPFAGAIPKGAAGASMMDPDTKLPTFLQWTFSVERQLSETFVVKVNYLGTRGTNLLVSNGINQPLTIVKDGRQYTPNTAGIAKLPNPNFTGIGVTAPIVDQYYHAGQLVVEKRFSSGLRFNSSYTWSKNLDNGGGAGNKCAEQIGGGGGVASNIGVYNTYDRGGDRGLSVFDIRHNFLFSYTYDLPIGPGRRWGSQWKGVMDRLLGGWGINGTSSIRSGLPTLPSISACRSFRSGTGNVGCGDRPDLRPGGNNNPVLENWTPESYFDISPFVVPPLGFFGNVGRNTIVTPGIFNWNFSLAKDNRLGEEKNLEFRAEFFNFFNHPNFGQPFVNVFRNAAGDPGANVGRITSTTTRMRQIQFGLKLTF